MDPASETRDLDCRLERTDGSLWRVTALDLEGAAPTVTAVRDDTTADREAAESRLEDEPLRRGDRLVWLDDAGEVVWALRSPLGPAA